MQKEQTKKILINILTGIIILGVLIVGYNVFTRNKPAPSKNSTPPVGTPLQTTESIGNEIYKTIEILRGLKSSIKNSAVVFNLPAFKSLNDLTIGIRPLAPGRENPFISTRILIPVAEKKDPKKENLLITPDPDTITTRE